MSTRRRVLPLVSVELSTLLSGTANGVTSVVLPWLVLERSGSAAAAGLVAAAVAVPLVVSAVVSGTAVDRVGRRLSAIVSDVVSAVAAAAIPLVAWLGSLDLTLLVVLAAFGAVLDPLGVTAREVMLPEAARAAKLRLSRANGFHEAVWGMSFVIGPGIGGVLIGVIGPTSALWATTVAFLLSAAVMVLARVPGAGRPEHRVTDGTTGARAFLRDTREGLRFVRRDKLVLSTAVVSTLVLGTYLPIEAVLLPVLFESQDAPERLGVLLLVMSAGWITGSVLYGAIGHRLPRRALFVGASIGTAVALVPMAFLPPYPVLLVSGALAGLMYGPIDPLLNLVLQRRSPPQMRGRVLGVLVSADYVVAPLGFLFAGVLVDRAGIGTAFAVVVAVMVVAALSTLRLGSLREMASLTDEHEGGDDDVHGPIPLTRVTS